MRTKFLTRWTLKCREHVASEFAARLVFTRKLSTRYSRYVTRSIFQISKFYFRNERAIHIRDNYGNNNDVRRLNEITSKLQAPKVTMSLVILISKPLVSQARKRNTDTDESRSLRRIKRC